MPASPSMPPALSSSGYNSDDGITHREASRGAPPAPREEGFQYVKDLQRSDRREIAPEWDKARGEEYSVRVASHLHPTHTPKGDVFTAGLLLLQLLGRLPKADLEAYRDRFFDYVQRGGMALWDGSTVGSSGSAIGGSGASSRDASRGRAGRPRIPLSRLPRDLPLPLPSGSAEQRERAHLLEELLTWMLQPEPHKRPEAVHALSHAWLSIGSLRGQQNHDFTLDVQPSALLPLPSAVGPSRSASSVVPLSGAETSVGAASSPASAAVTTASESQPHVASSAATPASLLGYTTSLVRELLMRRATEFEHEVPHRTPDDALPVGYEHFADNADRRYLLRLYEKPEGLADDVSEALDMAYRHMTAMLRHLGPHRSWPSSRGWHPVTDIETFLDNPLAESAGHGVVTQVRASKLYGEPIGQVLRRLLGIPPHASATAAFPGPGHAHEHSDVPRAPVAVRLEPDLALQIVSNLIIALCTAREMQLQAHGSICPSTVSFDLLTPAAAREAATKLKECEPQLRTGFTKLWEALGSVKSFSDTIFPGALSTELSDQNAHRAADKPAPGQSAAMPTAAAPVSGAPIVQALLGLLGKASALPAKSAADKILADVTTFMFASKSFAKQLTDAAPADPVSWACAEPRSEARSAAASNATASGAASVPRKLQLSYLCAEASPATLALLHAPAVAAGERPASAVASAGGSVSSRQHEWGGLVTVQANYHSPRPDMRVHLHDFGSLWVRQLAASSVASGMAARQPLTLRQHVLRTYPSYLSPERLVGMYGQYAASLIPHADGALAELLNAGYRCSGSAAAQARLKALRPASSRTSSEEVPSRSASGADGISGDKLAEAALASKLQHQRAASGLGDSVLASVLATHSHLSECGWALRAVLFPHAEAAAALFSQCQRLSPEKTEEAVQLDEALAAELRLDVGDAFGLSPPLPAVADVLVVADGSGNPARFIREVLALVMQLERTAQLPAPESAERAGRAFKFAAYTMLLLFTAGRNMLACSKVPRTADHERLLTCVKLERCTCKIASATGTRFEVEDDERSSGVALADWCAGAMSRVTPQEACGIRRLLLVSGTNGATGFDALQAAAAASTGKAPGCVAAFRGILAPLLALHSAALPGAGVSIDWARPLEWATALPWRSNMCIGWGQLDAPLLSRFSFLQPVAASDVCRCPEHLPHSAAQTGSGAGAGVSAGASPGGSAAVDAAWRSASSSSSAPFRIPAGPMASGGAGRQLSDLASSGAVQADAGRAAVAGYHGELPMGNSPTCPRGSAFDDVFAVGMMLLAFLAGDAVVEDPRCGWLLPRAVHCGAFAVDPGAWLPLAVGADTSAAAKEAKVLMSSALAPVEQQRPSSVHALKLALAPRPRHGGGPAAGGAGGVSGATDGRKAGMMSSAALKPATSEPSAASAAVAADGPRGATDASSGGKNAGAAATRDETRVSGSAARASGNAASSAAAAATSTALAAAAISAGPVARAAGAGATAADAASCAEEALDKAIDGLGVDPAAASALAAATQTFLRKHVGALPTGVMSAAAVSRAAAIEKRDLHRAARLLLAAGSAKATTEELGLKLTGLLTEESPVTAPLRFLRFACAAAALGEPPRFFAERHTERAPFLPALRLVSYLLDEVALTISLEIHGDAAKDVPPLDESERETISCKARAASMTELSLALLGWADVDKRVSDVAAAQDRLRGLQWPRAPATGAKSAARALEAALVGLARSCAAVALAVQISIEAAYVGDAESPGREMLAEVPPLVAQLQRAITMEEASPVALDALVGALAFVLDATGNEFAWQAADKQTDAGLDMKAAALRSAAARKGVQEPTREYANHAAQLLERSMKDIAEDRARRWQEEEDAARRKLADEFFVEMLARDRQEREAAKRRRLMQRARQRRLRMGYGDLDDTDGFGDDDDDDDEDDFRPGAAASTRRESFGRALPSASAAVGGAGAGSVGTRSRFPSDSTFSDEDDAAARDNDF